MRIHEPGSFESYDTCKYAFRLPRPAKQFFRAKLPPVSTGRFNVYIFR